MTALWFARSFSFSFPCSLLLLKMLGLICTMLMICCACCTHAYAYLSAFLLGYDMIWRLLALSCATVTHCIFILHLHGLYVLTLMLAIVTIPYIALPVHIRIRICIRIAIVLAARWAA